MALLEAACDIESKAEGASSAGHREVPVRKARERALRKVDGE